MGSLFKAKTKTTQNPFESNPWEPQQEFLKEGFNAGQNALGGALANNAGITDFTADLNPTQINAMKSMTDLGTGQMQNVGQQFTDTGGGMLNDLSRSSDATNAFADRATTDRTGQIIDRGMQYAENPFMQDQIDAAIKDVNRGFQRDQAGINGAAVGAGAINSTRAGVMEALAMDDAMDRSGSISSNMRSAAYESGMNRSMMQDQNMTNDQLSAIGALSNSGAMGADLMSTGMNTRAMGNEMAFGAGGIAQGQAQSEINGQREMSREEMDLIKQYMGIVGGNYGSKGYQTSTSKSASPFQQIAGATTAIMGAF